MPLRHATLLTASISLLPTLASQANAADPTVCTQITPKQEQSCQLPEWVNTPPSGAAIATATTRAEAIGWALFELKAELTANKTASTTETSAETGTVTHDTTETASREVTNETICGLTVHGLGKKYKHNNEMQNTSTVRIIGWTKGTNDDEDSVEFGLKLYKQSSVLDGKASNEGTSQVSLPLGGMDKLISHIHAHGCAVSEVWNGSAFYTMVKLK